MLTDNGAVMIYNSGAIIEAKKNPFSIKVRMPQKLEGGEIVEVASVDHAKVTKAVCVCCIIISEPNIFGISISNFLQMNFNQLL